MKFGEERVVDKPWGREVFLEINDKYCLKRIEINAGYVTSLQYHNYKTETIVLLSGEATLFHGGITSDQCTQRKLKIGECFTVYPNEIHRMRADTDIVFYEGSSNEVWDVVRLEDSYDRK